MKQIFFTVAQLARRMEALEAASPKIKEVMADMMPFFGGPPEPLMGELSWTSPGATL